MNRREFKWVVDVLGMGLDELGMNRLLADVCAGRRGEVELLLGRHIAAHYISDVYDQLAKLSAGVDQGYVDLEEITRGQWSSLAGNVLYVARMSDSIASMTVSDAGWLFGSQLLGSLDSVQQIWRVVER